MGLDKDQAPGQQMKAIKDAARDISTPTIFNLGQPANGAPGLNDEQKESIRAWLEDFYGVPYIIDASGDFAIPA